jgi:hypothetical protein
VGLSRVGLSLAVSDRQVRACYECCSRPRRRPSLQGWRRDGGGDSASDGAAVQQEGRQHRHVSTAAAVASVRPRALTATSPAPAQLAAWVRTSRGMRMTFDRCLEHFYTNAQS